MLSSPSHPKGWIALPERYDDGGFTGANMDRPALARLLRAVEARELDCVVVYKVDRTGSRHFLAAGFSLLR